MRKQQLFRGWRRAALSCGFAAQRFEAGQDVLLRRRAQVVQRLELRLAWARDLALPVVDRLRADIHQAGELVGRQAETVAEGADALGREAHFLRLAVGLGRGRLADRAGQHAHLALERGDVALEPRDAAALLCRDLAQPLDLAAGLAPRYARDL